jgi:RNA polymerase sigma-70 factor (ECF subfamily)
VSSPYAADLELAARCAAGDAAAWERFVVEYRPVLYRAADALDRTGRARDIADSLYADLYGLKNGATVRQSLFRYFHGRSSLATWLRAVLAQRFVDRVRAERRLEPLPDEDPSPALAAAHRATDTRELPDPDRGRYVALLRDALGRAIARLTPRDRLRLACYYAQELTLAETGRVMKEHEATVSRQLARARTAIRDDIESQLRDEAGLSEAQVADCLSSVTADPGPLDLTSLLDARPAARQRSV